MANPYPEHYTIEDYRSWPGDWELIDGAPFAMTPSPGVTHQAVALAIASQLRAVLAECPVGQVLMAMDWDVSPDTVVRPDVMILCFEPGERVTRAPDWIAEVVSPRTAQRAKRLKMERYAREGVLWYLLVYPEGRRVRIHRLRDGRYEEVADRSTERCVFELTCCTVALDLTDIWPR